MKKLLYAALIMAALVWGLWVIAVPGALLVDTIEDSVRRDGISVEVEGFRKGLFYNFTAQGVHVNKGNERLLSVRDLRGRIDLLRLFALKAAVPFEGSIGGGTLEGEAVFERNGHEISLNIDGAEAGKLALIGLADLKGNGILSGDFQMTDGHGRARFSIDEAKFETVAYSDVIVPLNLFESAKGLVRFKGNTVEVESITLEGPGVFARAKGSIKGGRLDMKLELMPEETAVPDYLLTAVIGQYRVSRGYYVIPLRTTLRGL